MNSAYFPISKREETQLKEIETAFIKKKIVCFDNETNAQFLDMLNLLMERKVIQNIEIDNGNVYRLIGSFQDFWNWIDDQEKKSRRLSRKEWIQCLLSGLGGVLLTLLLQSIIPIIFQAIE